MKRCYLFIPALLYITNLIAQVDFSKMQQEYVSRKPALDSMRAYPEVPYTSIKVTNNEGTSIATWWLAREKKKGTVLLVHGFAMNKSFMLSRAKVYYDLDYNVLLMDLRARGESGGVTTTSGPEISADVIAVMTYYADSLSAYGPLILAGYSHGCRAIVFAAEKKVEIVKALILESIPYSLSEGFKRIYKVNPPPFPEGNIDKAFQSVSKIPILLMIGEKDNAIVPEEAQKIKATFANSKSRVVVFDGAVHDLTGEKYKSLYAENIKAFLSATLR